MPRSSELPEPLNINHVQSSHSQQVDSCVNQLSPRVLSTLRRASDSDIDLKSLPPSPRGSPGDSERDSSSDDSQDSDEKHSKSTSDALFDITKNRRNERNFRENIDDCCNEDDRFVKFGKPSSLPQKQSLSIHLPSSASELQRLALTNCQSKNAGEDPKLTRRKSATYGNLHNWKAKSISRSPSSSSLSSTSSLSSSPPKFRFKARRDGTEKVMLHIKNKVLKIRETCYFRKGKKIMQMDLDDIQVESSHFDSSFVTIYHTQSDTQLNLYVEERSEFFRTLQQCQEQGSHVKIIPRSPGSQSSSGESGMDSFSEGTEHSLSFGFNHLISISHDFEGDGERTVSVKAGDFVTYLSKKKGWLYVMTKDEISGYIPPECVHVQ
eukprot:gb/GECH01013857.1/.p1 GENE.gb/GECH01013857.1/~~gb/GECH01013857.1/.p1  ORF type:complete len:380 (+),score=77.12 gb/GECH01013857.1/:1-1140(+)